MTALLVVACAAAGVACGPLVDLAVTRVPRRERVLGTGAADALRPQRAIALAVACGALLGALAAAHHDTWALASFLVLTVALLALSLIDLEHFLLPNRIVYPLAGGTVALLVLAALLERDGGAIVRALLGGLTAFAFLGVLHVISPRSMGFGDVKLAFVLGLDLGWLGWGEVLLGLFLGFVAGALAGVVLIVLRRRGRKDHLPFGPFLAIGTLVTLLAGSAILDWYTRS